ncbi:MAG: signal peptidase I [Desulfotalea sp.]
MVTKNRRPWLAGLLALLTPAIGYAYAGKLQKGIIISFLLLLLSPALAIFLKVQITKTILLSLVIILISIAFFLFIDCYKTAKKAEKNYVLKPYNKWWTYISLYIIFGILLSSLSQNYTKNNLIQAFKIPAGSMLPTLEIGDHLLINRGIYKKEIIQQGDIVVFPMPQKPEVDYIKRVVALEGDIIEILNKELFINGKKQDNRYTLHLGTEVIPKESSPRDNLGPIQIPEGNVFVMGDNRDNSYDSRFYGFIPTKTVKGKFVQIYWSWDVTKSLFSTERFKSIRWNRIGKTVN